MERRTNEFCVGLLIRASCSHLKSFVLNAQCSKTYEIRFLRKTVSANDIQQVYRVIWSQRNIVHGTSA